jgi:hypothetical protein
MYPTPKTNTEAEGPARSSAGIDGIGGDGEESIRVPSHVGSRRNILDGLFMYPD